MTRTKRTLVGLAALFAMTGFGAAVNPGVANAAVYDCGSWHDATFNYAMAYCGGGFGNFRVGATCNAPSPPYSITIYGRWTSRSSGQGVVYSYPVSGDNYSCHIVSSWVSV